MTFGFWPDCRWWCGGCGRATERGRFSAVGNEATVVKRRCFGVNGVSEAGLSGDPRCSWSGFRVEVSLRCGRTAATSHGTWCGSTVTGDCRVGTRSGEPWPRTSISESEAASLTADLASAVGVPAIPMLEPRDVEAACVNRDDCWNPTLQPGALIRRGSSTGSRCRAAFWIKVTGTSKYQYVTAGHCSHLIASTDWYHQAYGALGNRKKTLYNGTYNHDIARHGASNSMRTKKMYGSLTNVGISYTQPATGTSLVASLGKSNTVVAGTVDDGYDTWTGAACSCTMIGADSDLAADLGDSGSPIWKPTTFGNGNAMGVVATTSGRFARVSDATSDLGITFNW